VDIDGDAWLNPPSIGADQFNVSSATGALAVAISENFTNISAGFPVDFWRRRFPATPRTTAGDFGDGRS